MLSSFRLPLFILSIGLLGCLAAQTPVHAQTVRARAVLSLDMRSVDAGAVDVLQDKATQGAGPDAVTVSGGANRIAPVFGNGSDGHSLLLSPTKSQFVSIANSDDVSRPDAVTVSGLFASLHADSDKVFRGLFAKRQPGGKSVSNYGINYSHASDVFQLYVNDGNGYRIAAYSVKQVLASRRRVHLTVCLANADAPGADADSDPDDIQVRLFVNGSIVAPRSVNTGFVDGNTAWFTDITLDKCVSETPLTVGASFKDGELTQVIVDDFLVFTESLSDVDVAKLFREVAGPAADELLKEQKGSAAADSRPQVTRLSSRAVQIGASAEIVVQGRRLKEAELLFSVPGIQAVRDQSSNAQRAVFKVTVGGQVMPARCLMRIASAGGVSDPIVFCFDRLPQFVDGKFTEEQPLKAMPVAISGVLSGTDQKRVWFQGKKDQVVVAEVEARRIGSRLDPVVELKNGAGAALAIQWQQPELAGDARVRVVLPLDGLYYAEVHDMQYRAPGNSPWRLLLGALPAASLSFPHSNKAASDDVQLLGSVFADTEVVTSATSPLPVPPLAVSAGLSIVESLEKTFGDEPFDTTFATAPFAPVSFWGRISTDDQVDSINLKVSPGQTLYVSAFARRISSPLRPEIAIYAGEKRLARSNGGAGAEDPSLTLQVPDKVEQIRVDVRDFTNQGSSAAMYRLDVGKADRPGFAISTSESVIELPRNGSVPISLTVTRKSDSFQYFGPLRLGIRGASGVRVVPDVIPAGDQNGEVFVLVVHDEEQQLSSGFPAAGLTIEASTTGLDADITQSVVMAIDAALLNTVHGAADELLSTTVSASPALLSLDGIPPVLFRGTTAGIPLQILPQQQLQSAFVRFDLRTTQVPRRSVANDPKSPLLPVVAAGDFQFVTSDVTSHSLRIDVPLDTPESELNAVIVADFIDQPLDRQAGQNAFTAPLRLPIRNALTLTLPAEPVNLTVGASFTLKPMLVRHPLFEGEIRIRIDGLPKGVTASQMTVAVDPTGESLLTLQAEASVKPGELANVTVVAATATGAMLLPPVPLRVVVAPAAAPE
jgi:hypothetical protein